MKFHGFVHGQEAGGRQGLLRSVRLTTGLILFAYATSHFINHAFGIRSIAAMSSASTVLLAPWQSYPGLVALYGSLLAHGLLGFHALYRRRHLRLPASEAWQLALGLCIPLLLIPHAAAIRLGTSLHGLEYGYPWLMYQFWVVSPDFSLPRQLLLLLVVWIHGCIGLRAWLRSRPWYERATPVLATLATLVPTIAVLGFVSAGLDLREAVQRGAIDTAQFIRTPAAAQSAEAAGRIVDGLSFVYLGLLATVFVLRGARDLYGRRFRAIRITYPGHRSISVPRGFSILEASRWAGIPHESVCGGRGRCSTCRVRVIAGADALRPPSSMEQRTLRRIGAPPDVRLACQVRPSDDVTVQPLVRPRRATESDALRYDAAIEGGMELEIAAMFIDLRESTRLAAGRLPYDVLFLFDRYIQVVTSAIRDHDGHITSVAGDGVMSAFAAGGAAAASRNAFAAALGIWRGLERLNEELAGELTAPLRAGIGIHMGLAIVGRISASASQSLQFLGDTGNIAAKLEAQSKLLGCTLVASTAALKMAAPGARAETAVVPIPGTSDTIEVAVFKDRRDFARLVAQFPSAE